MNDKTETTDIEPLSEGPLVAQGRHVSVAVKILPTGHPFHFELERESPLLEVLERGLELSGSRLIPPPSPPLDKLHDLLHGHTGPAITDLDQPLWEYLRHPDTSGDFGIQLVLAFRVNARWAVAPEPAMTPREILKLVGLDFEQYTLYAQGSSVPLPLDTAIKILWGEVFEAQRDGKYGSR
jgi:hypothetical protein